MAISGRLRGISTGTDTQKVVKETLTGATSAEQKALKKLFTGAASADGNRHLSTAEANLVRDAFDTAKASGDFDMKAVEQTVTERITNLLKVRDPDGIKTYFSSTNKHLDDVIIKGFTDVIAKANGKPVEFNIMIFAFTDPQIAKSILDLAEAHDNVTFRMITDFGQMTTSGGRKPSYIAKEAKKRGLDNIEVKFKRDGAYTWSNSLKRPVYNHGSSKGLNHHKGYVALIDGKPVKVMTGSFNWSDTAQLKNWENLFEVDATNPANKQVVTAYQSEFVGFFNHKDALNPAEGAAHKRKVYNQLRVAHGLEPYGEPAPAAASPAYVPRIPGPSLDVNDMSDKNYDKLKSLVKDSATVRSIAYHFATYGAFTSFDNMLERVSKLSKLDDTTLDKLKAAFEFGDGQVPLNTANVSELMRGLKLSKKQATLIVAQRKKLGDFESVQDIKGLSGLSSSVFNRISERLNDDVARAYFSSRGYDDAKAGTGYGAGNATATTPVLGADGVVKDEQATLSAGVLDLLNRAQAGDEVKIAMYGLSASTPEYAAIIDAAARGVKFKIVLNKAYNEGVAAALKNLGESGLPIDVRMQKSKTMHMKFGVVNNDVFQGSANFSTSSSSKHSEDRFVVKNNDQLASEFSNEFDLLWSKSKAV